MPTPDVDSAIRQRIQAFVDELADLVKQATLESVQEALQGTADISATSRRLGASGGARPLGKGGKRTARELEQVTDQLLRYIEANPGERMEQIAEGMNLPSKELTLPMKRLLRSNKLRTKGQKRATTYRVR